LPPWNPPPGTANITTLAATTAVAAAYAITIATTAAGIRISGSFSRTF
jgi:hypothetical protein